MKKQVVSFSAGEVISEAKFVQKRQDRKLFPLFKGNLSEKICPAKLRMSKGIDFQTKISNTSCLC